MVVYNQLPSSAAIPTGRTREQEREAHERERALLRDRADAHEREQRTQAEREEAHQVRMYAEKAKRERQRQEKQNARERAAVDAQLAEAHSRRVGEMRTVSAAKEAEKREQDEEMAKMLEEGERVLAAERNAVHRQRQKTWAAHSYKEKLIAEEAREQHRASFTQARLRQEDFAALGELFHSIDADGTGLIEAREMMAFCHAVHEHGHFEGWDWGGKVVSHFYGHEGRKQFRAVLRDLGASANGRIGMANFREWWEEKGCFGHGIASEVLHVRTTGATGPGSGAALLEQSMRYIQLQKEVEAALFIQRTARGCQLRRWARRQQALNVLPGSLRIAATRIQSWARRWLARKKYLEMKKASVTICSAVRRRHAMVAFQLSKQKKHDDGYNFASRTIHVGGLGNEWVDADALKQWFEQDGVCTVLSVVVRLRKPEPEIPHNSWALVAFESQDTIDALMADADEVDGEPTVSIPPAVDDSVVFVIRRIDPVKAMTSVGKRPTLLKTALAILALPLA